MGVEVLVEGVETGRLCVCLFSKQKEQIDLSIDGRKERNIGTIKRIVLLSNRNLSTTGGRENSEEYEALLMLVLPIPGNLTPLAECEPIACIFIASILSLSI
jgi:hypothetical protein